VNLLVEPDDGFAPLMAHIKRARRTIDTTIFRFDLGELQKAFEAAVTRGVQVRAFIAHTNSDGEKLLRKLETELLAAGVILARSDDDLVRYHGKVLIVDREVLHVMLFNYTRLDINKSRSFAISTKNKPLVAEALKLFEADMTRQPYNSGHADLIVSPENSRPRLAAFIKNARRELLIYDPRVADPAMIRLLQERVRKGVDVRILGHVAKRAAGLTWAKMPGIRLHARVIIRDATRAFLGSQSLRQAQLDERREVGMITSDKPSVKKLRSVFELDWAQAKVAEKAEKPAEAAVAAAEPEEDGEPDDDRVDVVGS
jgi:phosphatidylserine/phosphatidylglycerophosphate/cardiolipin synthase-like enzyme